MEMIRPIVESIRMEEGPEGTFSVLKICKRVFCAILEPPDLLNEKFVSSIPAPQQYLCKRRMSRWGETFEVTGVPGRTDILFHPGNVVGDTEGCPILGQYVGKLRGERAVRNSGATFHEFMRIMRAVDEFLLSITYCL